ncbi:MAG: molecular chaperone TorD family protein, partial [Anaerolineales bacterium]|nr:molecular chaperone TorD family protein [Anaerolineales bacterium]
MNPREILLARQHSYQLLGNLFLNGVGEADRPVLAQLPELAPHLPEPFEADDMAATHQSLFGFNLLPYESVFLTSERVLGGHISDQLARQAGELRFYSGQSAQMDHIGQQLLLLAYLCGAELNMLDRGEVREAALWARAQAD